MRYELFIAFILVLSLTTAWEADRPLVVASDVEDAPLEGEGALPIGSQGLDDAEGSGPNLSTSPGGGAQGTWLFWAGSNEALPPVSILLNKAVWFEIENRTLEGSGPYGRLEINRVPTASPDFNRLLEDAGYAKVRDFGNLTGSSGWWRNPGAPELPGINGGQADGGETLQVKRFYVGWTFSKTYHYPDCRWAKNIPAGQQVWFSSPEEARAAGYSPCGSCQPP